MRILFMLPAARGVYSDEAAQRRIRLIKSYERPGIEIDVDYLPEPSGFSPWGGQNQPNHRPPELVARTHELGARRAAQAEKEGYDAYCPFGGVDVGVEQARRQGVQIPMSGPGEAAGLLCGMIGRPFASCSYVHSEDGNRAAEARYRALGIAHLHVASTAIGMENDQYPSHHDEVLQRFLQCAKEARAKGAELFGSFGQSICPTEFSARELSEACGMPCMDGIAAQIAIVEMWHRTGLPPSLLKVPR